MATTTLAPQQPGSLLYGQLRSEVKAYANILCILDKAESDAYLSLLNSSFQFIFQKEMLFAVSGLLNRASKAQRENAFLGSQLPAVHQHSHFQGESQVDNECFKLDY